MQYEFCFCHRKTCRLTFVDMVNPRIYREQKGSRENLGRPCRTKKRKHWRTFSSKVENLDSGEQPSASRRKIASDSSTNCTYDDRHSYRILSFISVFSAISSHVKCKICDSDLNFSETKVRGLGFNILVQCKNCNDREISSCRKYAASHTK